MLREGGLFRRVHQPSRARSSTACLPFLIARTVGGGGIQLEWGFAALAQLRTSRNRLTQQLT
ncbi:hypothetical protein CSH63_22055 [Micromonospora tulbaghiae]|uniref:Uncharacterized protein n=1 Tax=Micromonospora tulbaghiae TaxID=479978 RepID=A0A386WQD4_9ACTN|nr:hypothetical protein CSH63_22055 [Micromonospora tulbaghiae]